MVPSQDQCVEKHKEWKKMSTPTSFWCYCKYTLNWNVVQKVCRYAWFFMCHCKYKVDSLFTLLMYFCTKLWKECKTGLFQTKQAWLPNKWAWRLENWPQCFSLAWAVLVHMSASHGNLWSWTLPPFFRIYMYVYLETLQIQTVTIFELCWSYVYVCVLKENFRLVHLI